MNRNPWLGKAERLAILAEARRGTPEGDVALDKLRRVLKRHAEVRRQVTKSRTLLECDLSTMELSRLEVIL